MDLIDNQTLKWNIRRLIALPVEIVIDDDGFGTISVLSRLSMERSFAKAFGS